LGSEKYIRPSPPSTSATGPQSDWPAVESGVTVNVVASIRTSWSAPVTLTQTVPFGPVATDVGPAPTAMRPPTRFPPGEMRTTLPAPCSATQKLPSGPRTIPFVPDAVAKSWKIAALAGAGASSAAAIAASTSRRIGRPYRRRASRV
jgi:hypothetical protein